MILLWSHEKYVSAPLRRNYAMHIRMGWMQKMEEFNTLSVLAVEKYTHTTFVPYDENEYSRFWLLRLMNMSAEKSIA